MNKYLAKIIALDIDGLRHISAIVSGAKVLIDPKATMFLLGSVMDYRKDNLSSRFVFENPNEKSTCGCGESFSV